MTKSRNPLLWTKQFEKELLFRVPSKSPEHRLAHHVEPHARVRGSFIDFRHKSAVLKIQPTVVYRNFSRKDIYSPTLTIDRFIKSLFFVDRWSSRKRTIYIKEKNCFIIYVWYTHLTFCWSNPPSPLEAVSAGGSAPSAVARDKTRILPLPVTVAARRCDWRRRPRTVPSYCDNGCAGRTGIDWRTTFWSRRIWHRTCVLHSTTTLLSSLLASGPLPGPTSLSSAVPRLYKRGVV